MRNPILLSILSLITLTAASCQLNDIKSYGDRCPTDKNSQFDLSYIIIKDNHNTNKKIERNMENNKYSDFFDENRCPPSFQCSKSETGFYCMSCDEGQIPCNDKCIDPNTDTTYCGAKGTCTGSDNENSIGTTCEKGFACENGKCTTSCATGLEMCEKDGINTCVSLATDDNNCGSCNNKCNGNLQCIEQKCACPDNLNQCENNCYNLNTDINNCGSCGNKCSSGETCINAECKCKDGYTKCDDQCEYLINNENNCGTCGNKCGDNEICAIDTCTSCNDDGYFLREIEDKEGSKVKPFCIKNVEDLINLKSAINDNKHYPDDNDTNSYILVNDIELDSWDPIISFSGTFYGNYKSITVKKYNIDNSSDGNGFFKKLDNAYIHDLNLSMSIEDSDVDFTGILAGLVENSSIKNCNVFTQRVSSKKDSVGGLVGFVLNSSISDSTVCIDGTIDGERAVGGFVGKIQNDNNNDKIFINNSHAYINGNIFGHLDDMTNYDNSDQKYSFCNFGGFSGSNRGLIEYNNCFVTNNPNESDNTMPDFCKKHMPQGKDKYTATISKTGETVGGFTSGGSETGLNNENHAAEYNNCSARLDSIEAGSVIGGFAGAVGHIKIRNSSADIGKITAHRPDGNAGGFIGFCRDSSFEGDTARSTTIDAYYSAGFIATCGISGGTNISGCKIDSSSVSVSELSGTIVAGFISFPNTSDIFIRKSGAIIGKIKGSSVASNFLATTNKEKKIIISNSYSLVNQFDSNNIVSFPPLDNSNSKFEKSYSYGPQQYYYFFDNNESKVIIEKCNDDKCYFYKDNQKLSELFSTPINPNDPNSKENWIDVNCSSITRENNKTYYYPVLKDNIVDGCEQ